ncbi:MAG: F0F1 ATP synthase subunit delta [Candidatus Wildermuthbacteria bacterium]|nr:F0F1 ATP synthase subunit delta [Candidatus Wildermuthbacteria bacterium]
MSKKTRRYANALLNAVQNASEKEAKDRIARFLLLLKKRGDYRMLGQVLYAFKSAWKKKDGEVALFVRARAVSGTPDRVLEHIIERKGYKVEELVNKELIGGLTVFLGTSYCIDNSVKGRLKHIQALLTL